MKEIAHLKDFLGKLPTSDNLNRQLVFRGQAEDVPLIPSLFRNGHACIGENATWESYEKTLIKQFELEGFAYMENFPEDTLEQIVLAQHHGVPTRTLDWTSSPLFALYFAARETAKHGTDGVLYYYTPSESRVSPKFTWNELNEKENVFLFSPRHRHPRIKAQSGYLTIHPLPQSNDEFTPFEESVKSSGENNGTINKYTIRAENKERILFELENIGVSEDSIYPDLEGVAGKIRKRILRAHRKGVDYSTHVVNHRLAGG